MLCLVDCWVNQIEYTEDEILIVPQVYTTVACLECSLDKHSPKQVFTDGCILVR